MQCLECDTRHWGSTGGSRGSSRPFKELFKVERAVKRQVAACGLMNYVVHVASHGGVDTPGGILNDMIPVTRVCSS